MGSSRWREWVEAKLPWYHPHTERLRNVKSEILGRITTDTTEEARRVIDRRDLAVIAAYREADEKLRKR